MPPLRNSDDLLPPWQKFIEIVVWHCLRCGHLWLPREAVSVGFGSEDLPRLYPPVKCPGCGSHLWNKPKRDKLEKDVALAAERAIAGRRKGR